MNSKVVQSPSGRVTFTLIEPDTEPPAGPDRRLPAPGTTAPGCSTSRCAPTTSSPRSDASARAGCASLATPASYYDELEQRLGAVDAPLDRLRTLSILVDRDHWGQMFQIFTESMHVRRTLFLELIERHGARTFGSGNIKALYEAKERELAAARGDRAAVADATTTGSGGP